MNPVPWEFVIVALVLPASVSALSAAISPSFLSIDHQGEFRVFNPNPHVSYVDFEVGSGVSVEPKSLILQPNQDLPVFVFLSTGDSFVTARYHTQQQFSPGELMAGVTLRLSQNVVHDAQRMQKKNSSAGIISKRLQISQKQSPSIQDVHREQFSLLWVICLTVLAGVLLFLAGDRVVKSW